MVLVLGWVYIRLFVVDVVQPLLRRSIEVSAYEEAF